MPRYIDAEALTAEFKRLTLGENSLIERVFADGVYAVIETFPAADVVEVVRCRDCVHHDDCICVVCEEGETVVCKRESRHVRKDFSCIYGKRREE